MVNRNLLVISFIHNEKMVNCEKKLLLTKDKNDPVNLFHLQTALSLFYPSSTFG